MTDYNELPELVGTQEQIEAAEKIRATTLINARANIDLAQRRADESEARAELLNAIAIAEAAIEDALEERSALAWMISSSSRGGAFIYSVAWRINPDMWHSCAEGTPSRTLDFYFKDFGTAPPKSES